MKTHNSKLHTEKSSLTCAVLDRIEKDAVTPRPAWKFVCMNCLMWGAWGLSVLCGAVAVAVLLYVGDYAWFALYEATHESAFAFFIEAIPFLWVGTFVGMGIFAYYNIRHTRRGYRYPLWKLLVSSMVLSVGVGLVLHWLGVGYKIDTLLDQNMPPYQSLERGERHLWQSPEEGRLLGTFTRMDGDQTTYLFTDTDNQMWSVQTAELRDKDKELLSSGEVVRLLGTTTDAVAYQFHVCGVFPWMFNNNVSVQKLRQDRRRFVQRMYEHMEKGERLKKFEHSVYDENHDMPFEEESVCVELSVMKRMKFK